MKLVGFDIELVRLTGDWIELVRHWRNSPEVNCRMIYQEAISKEAQLKWFKTIDNVQNFYFVIFSKQVAVGIIDTKNVDWDKRTGEGGIFIGEIAFVNTPVPLGASFLNAFFCFDVLRLNALKAKVLKTNAKTIRYNKNLGYEIKNEKDEHLLMEVTRSSFLNASAKNRKIYNQLLEKEFDSFKVQNIQEILKDELLKRNALLLENKYAIK